MTTQLQYDLGQAVINYLQIQSCVSKDIHWVLNDMYEKRLVSETVFIACDSLLESNNYDYGSLDGTANPACLQLAFEIMPKYVRDNLNLTFTLFKLSKRDNSENNLTQFLENVYGEFETTKELLSGKYGIWFLVKPDEWFEDADVDKLIRLTFPGIFLASTLDAENTNLEDSEIVEEEEFKKEFRNHLVKKVLIPTQVKELGHSYLKIWEYLRDNQENWFTANQLAEQLECTPQWVRDAIGTMRKQGIDIFGHTRKGYILRTSVVDQLVE